MISDQETTAARNLSGKRRWLSGLCWSRQSLYSQSKYSADRGVEEACHHSLVLSEEDAGAACRYLGFRVLTDRELELAERWFAGAGVSTQWIERPYQGRTLAVSSGAGFPVEFCASMEVQPRLFTNPAYASVPARRLDHFQLFHPRVEEACEFYAKIGFRGSEYVEDADGVVGVFMYRKGNTHDLVFFRRGAETASLCIYGDRPRCPSASGR